jgi:hypothetical protein
MSRRPCRTISHTRCSITSPQGRIRRCTIAHTMRQTRKGTPSQCWALTRTLGMRAGCTSPIRVCRRMSCPTPLLFSLSWPYTGMVDILCQWSKRELMACLRWAHACAGCPSTRFTRHRWRNRKRNDALRTRSTTRPWLLSLPHLSARWLSHHLSHSSLDYLPTLGAGSIRRYTPSQWWALTRAFGKACRLRISHPRVSEIASVCCTLW